MCNTWGHGAASHLRYFSACQQSAHQSWWSCARSTSAQQRQVSSSTAVCWAGHAWCHVKYPWLYSTWARTIPQAYPLAGDQGSYSSTFLSWKARGFCLAIAKSLLHATEIFTIWYVDWEPPEDYAIPSLYLLHKLWPRVGINRTTLSSEKRPSD